MSVFKLKVNKNNRTIVLFCLLLISVWLRYGVGIAIPMTFFLGIAIGIAIIGNNTDIVSLSICCIPLHTSIQYMLVVAISILIFFVKNIKKIKVDFSYILFVFLIIWELLHGILYDFTYSQLAVIAIPYLLLLIVHSYRGKELDYCFITRMYALYVIGVGFSLITRTLFSSHLSLLDTISTMNRLGLNEGAENIVGGIVNPNSLGIMCVLGIAGLIQIYLYKNKKISDIIFIIILVILGIFTLSKTYLLCLIVMFMLFLISERKSIKKNVKIVYIVCGILCFSCIIVYVFPQIVQSYLERWMIEDFSNGRIGIFLSSMEYIWKNESCYLFGLGLSDFANKATNVVTLAPHDAISEIIMAWGIPGFLLFILFLVLIANSAHKINKRIRLINYIILIILLVKGIAGHFITSGYTMLALTLAYLSLICDF